MAGTLLRVRCNPYGAEHGGPRRVLGGLYGPNSATTPRDDLPLNVQQGEWPCDRPAEVRCRMVCRHQHRGQIMELCSWHDEVNYQGQRTGGDRFTPEARTVRVRGHFEEIQRRQSGSCPRCLYPDARQSGNGIDYAALQKEWDSIGATLHNAWMMSGSSYDFFRSPRTRSLQQRRDDIGLTFDEGRALGIVHNCPMTLVAVS